MGIFQCQLCQGRRKLWKRLCPDCTKLFQLVKANLGQMGFGELLDTLIATGIDKNRVQMFLKANPHGKGSILDQITAQLTNNLAEGMGVKRQDMTAEDVQRIRNQPVGLASSKPLDQ